GVFDSAFGWVKWRIHRIKNMGDTKIHDQRIIRNKVRLVCMSNEQIQIIAGDVATDHRGQIRFVNGFDMTEIKRFYIIKNSDTNLVRGWRGHRIEKRWFYVLSGAFFVDIVKIDDWNRTSPELPIKRFRLSQTDQKVLYVPEGHATALK